ncbi:MAG: transcriptional regulator [Lysobacterales bacterium 14-68-21]|jgi:transcriptional regulator with XRE-family HTH domain|nr:MAG: transcriptional regulator [Xanthomonadales bacterium 15-68-25]OZB67857.1 MAG: transcriptional regulator [Xanthomonadales bacterium 14-68-21]
MNTRRASLPPQSIPEASGLEPVPNPSNSFAERIRLLIQRVGSATEIARMCGFSEGVVRSWRDGNSDPSRARCVTLAKTLGISLVWLVAGEGAIQPDAVNKNSEEQSTTEVRGSSRNREPSLAQSLGAGHQQIIDGQGDHRRLEAARRLLKSNLVLAGAQPTAAEQEQMLAALYEIVGPEGTRIDADALLAFQQALAERSRQDIRTMA